MSIYTKAYLEHQVRKILEENQSLSFTYDSGGDESIFNLMITSKIIAPKEINQIEDELILYLLQELDHSFNSISGRLSLNTKQQVLLDFKGEVTYCDEDSVLDKIPNFIKITIPDPFHLAKFSHRIRFWVWISICADDTPYCDINIRILQGDNPFPVKELEQIKNFIKDTKQFLIQAITSKISATIFQIDEEDRLLHEIELNGVLDAQAAINFTASKNYWFHKNRTTEQRILFQEKDKFFI